MIRRLLVLALFAGSLVLVFGSAYLRHLELAADPYTFTDDARAWIPPLYKEIPPDDTIKQYYLRTHLSAGFTALYQTLSLFADPQVLSKYLPYPLLAAMLVLMAMASYRLGSAATAWATLVLALSTALFLERMTGGLARAFAFPIVAMALWGLVAGRACWLAAATLLGAAFYPPAGVLSGASLVAVSFLPERHRGDMASWSLRKRLLLVGGAALLSALMLLPQFLAGGDYGPRLTAADAAAYPETGEGGRYGVEDRAPYPSVLNELAAASYRSLMGAGDAWFAPLHLREASVPLTTDIVILILSLFYFGFTGWRGDRAALLRVLLLPVAVVTCHTLSLLAAPYAYLPQRYVLYSFPVILLTLFPVALRQIMQKRTLAEKHAWFPDAGMLAAVLAVLLLFGGRGQSDAGYTVKIPADDRPLYEALATLPQEAVIAGWPMGMADNIPYLSRRRVLMNYETHQVFHREYTDLMRKRFSCLSRGYFATERAVLLAVLREECGITHLVVEKPLLAGDAPTYFKPFTGEVKTLWEENKEKSFLLADEHAFPVIFENARFRVIQLIP
ncbi:MAG: hypothetical protein J0L97_01050 [Alphaproteobacteria bacterium]|nr:hypothetical protein [Alphaproteobacteria bacterium]